MVKVKPSRLRQVGCLHAWRWINVLKYITFGGGARTN